MNHQPAITLPTHLSQDATPYLRRGWWVIGLGVAGFLCWASLAPLDKGVPVSGTLIVEGYRKSLHHPTGGQVEALLVQEGSEVRAGQLLVRMNATQTQAEAESLRLQLNSAVALRVRLQAERDGLPEIIWPAEMLLTTDAMQSQQSLFALRRQTLQNTLETFDELIAGNTYQLQGLKDAQRNRELQRQALDEQLTAYRTLAGNGHISRNQLLEMERLYAQVNADLAENLGDIGQLQHQIQEIQLRKNASREEFLQNVHTQLADTELRVQGLSEYLRSAEYALANTQVLAPTDGVVIGMKIFTEGGFVSAGSHLLDILPSNTPLLVDMQIPVHLIDSVYPGLPVLLTLSAFNQNTTPQLPAMLERVTPDRLVDTQTGLPYYQAQARIDESALQNLMDLNLRPGMPVDLFIRTGERTLLSYLFKPLKDRARTAMTEA